MRRVQTWHLGVVAAVAVAAAVFVTVENRGSHAGPRGAVAVYIKSVDTVQQQMRVPLTNVLVAYRDYAKRGASTRRVARELARAQATLERFARRVSVLPAPAEARHLRTLLIQLGEAESSTAGEVGKMARFTTAYRPVLATSSAARIALGRALAAAPVPKPRSIRGTANEIATARSAYKAAADRAAADQADAVDMYVARLAVIQRRLRELDPPPAMAPGYRIELRTLRGLRTSGARLAAALRRPDRSHVPALARRFEGAARLAGTVGAQRAEIAAVKAYNRRVRSIAALQRRVQTELARLQQTLA